MKRINCKQIKIELNRLNKTPFSNRAIAELEIPHSIVNKEIPELEQLLSDIFINFNNRGLINDADLHDLHEAYGIAKAAHDKTGDLRRGSKKPYIHHPLAVTIYAMHLAELINFKEIDIKYLLLGAMYHDTLEDTEVFNTRDTGKQFSEFGKKYGNRFGIILYYVTKIPLNIDPSLEKLENHIKRVHLIVFENDFVPLEARIIKIADRMMNLTDLQYLSKEKVIEAVYFTEKHFQPVLKFMPTSILSLFWSHLVHIRQMYSITDNVINKYKEKLNE